MSESNNPWKMMVIGCSVLAVIGCCCCVGFGGFIASKAVGPSTTVGVFVAAASTGNIDLAYAQMTPEFQAAHPKANFASELATLPGVAGGATFNPTSFNTENGVTVLSGTLKSTAGEQPASFELVTTGETHRIRSISVGSVTLR